MIDFLRQHWSTISSIGACSISVLVMFLATKFARREELNEIAHDVSRLKKDVSIIQGRMESMPTKDDIHKLNLEISGLRGDIKGIKPELASVQRISDLLLENELKEGKK